MAKHWIWVESGGQDVHINLDVAVQVTLDWTARQLRVRYDGRAFPQGGASVMLNFEEGVPGNQEMNYVHQQLARLSEIPTGDRLGSRLADGLPAAGDAPDLDALNPQERPVAIQLAPKTAALLLRLCDDVQNLRRSVDRSRPDHK